jgi:glutathione S-transferase
MLPPDAMSPAGTLLLALVAVPLIVEMALEAPISYCARHRKFLAGNALLIADAGFAGFLFWIPTLLIGTPTIEFRTMLLFGMTLALPFVAVGLERRKSRMLTMKDPGNYYAVA